MRGLFVLALLIGCGRQEGTEFGDCEDAADNDGDGLFDCDDDGCAGSPVCDEADTDTDSDTDADTDSDTDADTDSDTDADTDADTDSDTDADTDSDTDADTDSDPDLDGDGYGASVDCDDDDDTVHPAASEICDNGKDDDCDGTVGPCGFSGSTRLPASEHIIGGDRAYDRFGRSVAVGDVNGDGQDDLVASAMTAACNTSVTNCGKVYTVLGPITGDRDVWTDAASTFVGGASLLARPIALGDLDGDGDDDLLVGGPGLFETHYTDGMEAGKAWVVLSPAAATVDAASADTILTAESTEKDAFGSDVAVGDLTGDGIADAIVGERGSSVYTTVGGAVYVFAGPVKTASAKGAAVKIYGDGAPSSGEAAWYLGSSLEIVDLDGDGQDDLLTGGAWAPSASSSGYRGAVYAFEGPLSGAMLATTYDEGFFGEGWLAHPPGSIATGDFDGDGAIDLVAGGYGKVYLVTADQLAGKMLDADLLATWRVDGYGLEADELGASVQGAGDLDGDGSDDLIVGAPKDTYDAGIVYLWYGGGLTGTTDPTTADASWYSTEPGYRLGASLAVGDLDGTGATDLVFGADMHHAKAGAGAVVIVPGAGW